MSHTDVEDNSSDNHDIQYLEHPAGIVEQVNVDSVTGDLKKDQSPTTATANTTERLSDVASIQSASPLGPVDDEQPSPPLPPSSPTRNATAAMEDHTMAAGRRRSTPDPRSSRRLSGFFNNLIHRREARTGTTIREEQRPAGSSSPQPDKSASDETARSSSPVPPAVVPPPPKLPAPTLQELGLSFSVLTANLSPSHFSTPPSSGAFLSPHYLLLCHAQGLDVLPLVSPPEPQPYALIRRVSFKSIVVMEQRGVLVAIAGRRDGVRVYALEEIRKAVEWRIDVEIRRERDRTKREMAKRIAAGVALDGRNPTDKSRKGSLSTPPPGESSKKPPGVTRKGSHGQISHTFQAPPVPLIPRTPTIRKSKRSPSVTPTPSTQPRIPESSGFPPPYASSDYVATASEIRTPNPMITLDPARSRSRGGSVSDVLSVPPLSRLASEAARPHDVDAKDWADSSDDEAINVVAAGSSGSQALDERTSAIASRHQASFSQSTAASTHSASQPHSSPVIARRNRPANLDLSLTRSNGAIPPPEPSPAPTLLTLRQALAHPSFTLLDNPTPEPDTPRGDLDPDDDDDERGSNSISLSQALLESRLPDLPPPGSTRPQAPILISSHPVASPDDEPGSPRNSLSQQSEHDMTTPLRNRRRRWSLMLTGSTTSDGLQSTSPTLLRSATATPSNQQTPTRAHRSASGRSHSQSRVLRRPSSANTDVTPTSALIPAPPLPDDATSMVASTSALSVTSATSATSSRTRFIPRIISNAFQSIKLDSERPSANGGGDSDSKRNNSSPMLAHTPPPKLEYVKLPGTKGSSMIKAVETAKKSFLAILCGENGEKVELFAGTYRTALGLSRTFILPDSPRSLELQLQGDDLVEVFLVFSQNVFGLEPATVRVREVRIGRAERRAARRRAREIRSGDAAGPNDSESALVANGEDESASVNVSIGVSVSVGSTVVASGTGPQVPQTPQYVASEHPQERSVPATPAATSTAVVDATQEGAEGTTTPAENGISVNNTVSDELVALVTARMGPYTTFQQLSFAPQFPLASIADEYVIPPTYPDFIGYRERYEPAETGDSVDLSQINFSPPGLPVPTASAPSKWFYRDPKGNVHGPWKPSLMQAWYKDGLLPPDLPVRKEEDTEYILLKDLRAQSVDPSHPFKPPPAPASTTPNIFQPSDKPLLKPISLLSQPKHFGPPALFFSTRGGHSTTIVDARGRSVLKSRFLWSEDERLDDEVKSASLMGRLGDIKRLEAVDIKDRSVLIAMRQGGVEAVDIGDALLKPGDDSRTALPQFNPALSTMSRRAPFIWKIGTPVAASASSTATATILSRPKGSHLSKPKLSAGLAKSPGTRTEFNVGDSEPEFLDEVLFLGRKNDEIYICERNAGSFRILRLCPSS
ncbi:hypothetical protein D9757_002783 [Collybiopsis confluens]|uniref:GYF domain-containing protein n=1 Tax=Collybiopsis confluens TaxID=2823264 RepID=A0A8H5HVS1_9AGAR|nr:hypothetical protein D9757_002783 [Collybiopsis confluens]